MALSRALAEHDSVRLPCDCVNALAREHGAAPARKGNGAGANVSLEDVCAEIEDLKTSIAGLHDAVAAIAGNAPEEAGRQQGRRPLLKPLPGASGAPFRDGCVPDGLPALDAAGA